MQRVYRLLVPLLSVWLTACIAVRKLIRNRWGNDACSDDSRVCGDDLSSPFSGARSTWPSSASLSTSEEVPSLWRFPLFKVTTWQEWLQGALEGEEGQFLEAVLGVMVRGRATAKWWSFGILGGGDKKHSAAKSDDEEVMRGVAGEGRQFGDSSNKARGGLEWLAFPLRNVENVQYLLSVSVGTMENATQIDEHVVIANRRRRLRREVTSREEPDHFNTPLVDSSSSISWQQNFTMIPDTGSYDFWLPGFDCVGCGGSHRYDPGMSSSAEATGEIRRVTYGDHTTVTGAEMLDVVKLVGSGATEASLSIAAQSFLRVVKFSSDASLVADGILGLAHQPSLSAASGIRHDPREAPSFITSLFKQHPELANRFAFFMAFRETRDFQSQIVFGHPNLNMFAKDKVVHRSSHPASRDRRQWLVSLKAVGLNGFPASPRREQRKFFGGTYGLTDSALVDSGTSLIALDQQLYNYVTAQLIEAGVCSEPDVCRCPTGYDGIIARAAPSLEFHFDDGRGAEEFKLCLGPREYLIKTSRHGSTCRPAISVGPPSLPYAAVLGMVFFRSYFTMFDADTQEIGFARSAASAMPAGSRCELVTVYNQRTALILGALSAMVVLVVAVCCLFPVLFWSRSYVQRILDGLSNDTAGHTDGIPAQRRSPRNASKSGEASFAVDGVDVNALIPPIRHDEEHDVCGDPNRDGHDSNINRERHAQR